MNYSPIIFNNPDPRMPEINLIQEDERLQQKVTEALKTAKEKIGKYSMEGKIPMDLFRYDITFCHNELCPHTKCMRHHTKIPAHTPVSVAMFGPGPSGKCDWRFDEDWDEVILDTSEEKNG